MSEEMLPPNPANRIHCQHSPTTRFESKRAAHQAEWEGVNFGRRYPRLGGQNCTPNNRRRLTWTRMKKIADRHLPFPRILHPWPEKRFLVTILGGSPVR